MSINDTQNLPAILNVRAAEVHCFSLPMNLAFGLTPVSNTNDIYQTPPPTTL